MSQLIVALKSREPLTPISTVGFSLGGNALLKYLGENPDQGLVDSAVAVCVPMVLAECAARLERGFSRFYQWWLLESLKKKIRDRDSTTTLPINVERVSGCRTFREFDDLVTAPLHGFRDADDYYQRVSARQFLGKIATLTLIIHAQDDPFMSPHVLAAPDEISPRVKIQLTSGGGHIGFVTGAVPLWGKYWLDQRIADAISCSASPGTLPSCESNDLRRID